LNPAFRIRDLPSDERPRERLARAGPAALSSEELLALLLGSGGRGESALDCARRLLASHGGLAGLAGLTGGELAREKGVGRARASAIEAAIEVGRRLASETLSARDLMKREGSPFVYDWIGQKCFEDSAPMGPWFTPAAYVADPNNLAIKLWVNGVLKQDSNTSRMVHSTAEQIAYLSRHVTLQPGDVIATGTPAGVGMPRGEFLKVGDEVKIEIEGLGTLTNRMVADA